MKAIVRQGGELEGWLGGPCIRDQIVQEALKCLAEGRPRLVYIGPSPSGLRAEEVALYDSMLGSYCVSGGSALLLLEPMNNAGLVIVGEGRIAQKVEEMAKLVGYRAVRISRDALSGRVERAQVAVIATMNAYDEQALEFALRAGVPYVLLVASSRRWRSLAQLLRSRGFSDEQLSRVKAPAGLDIGARTPEEIAVSIMAEVISLLNASRARAKGTPLEHERPALRDPVCGMLVSADTPYRLATGSETYYFCSEQCLHRFSGQASS
jgi:xanthine dehydrogenase accessory factor